LAKCSYEFCPRFDVPLCGTSERKYHRRPCKGLAKLVADRERFRKKYGDSIRRCQNCGKHRTLTWSVGDKAAPVGFDGYLRGEARICSEPCLIQFYDARPWLEKPAAYHLITGTPEDERPEPGRLREKLYGDDETLRRYVLIGSGHQHYPNRPCENCVSSH
jgi:hypothetical protein